MSETKTDDQDTDARDDRSGDDTPRLGARKAARAALEQFGALSNRDVEGVVAVERDGGAWTVVLEVVEDAHVPSSADVLAEYEVQLDDDGELIAYRRGERYVRGRADR
ncbi:gas vesicle protein [Georgenia alba]|uniref:Gas vesicle protein n=1 Tax=Georgenia alba TaxID=2233858 RepID=A0ABW2Q463_9MICO